MIITNILLFCIVLIEGCNCLIRLIRFSYENGRSTSELQTASAEDIPPIDEEIRRRMYA